MGPVKPFDVTVYGVALETYGLTEWNQISGLGLVTNGLIWECQNIWFNGCACCWSLAPTSWTLSSFGVTTTTWTLSSYGSTTTNWTLYSTYGIEDC